jgi:hypothetical protein
MGRRLGLDWAGLDWVGLAASELLDAIVEHGGCLSQAFYCEG